MVFGAINKKGGALPGGKGGKKTIPELSLRAPHDAGVIGDPAKGREVLD